MRKKTKFIIYGVIISICITTLVLAISLTLKKRSTSYPVVMTECGTVEGRTFKVITDSGNKQNVHEFLNIPYAASPTGNLRWRAPVSLRKHGACWHGMLKYNTEIIRCVQMSNNTTIGKEDCLILNVRSPVRAKDKNLPVLVWIHGGGMVFGHSRMTGYYPDNQLTASMDVVTVSINYRLNIFGFLSVKELWLNSADGGFGNYGIMDQILALQWIKENIGNFGGDPNDVTIFGESGGGTATYCLLSASLGLAKGLFHKMIASSGAPNIRTSNIEANVFYRPFINKTNCLRNNTKDVQTCLQRLDVETILVNYPMYTGPGSIYLKFRDYEWRFPNNTPTKGVPIQIIDPLVIKHSPSDLLPILQSLPEEHKIDILIGNMAQEPMHIFKPALSNWSDWNALKHNLEPKVNTFKNDLYPELLTLYKNKSRDKFMPSTITPYYIYSLMTADIILSCATTELAYNLTQYSSFKVYSYIVSQALSPIGKKIFYAEHGMDAAILFGFVGKKTTEDLKLKENLRDKFKGFIHSTESFEIAHRNRTMEFWNSTVHTWENPYHEKECKVLRDNGFLKHSWGNLGVWN